MPWFRRASSSSEPLASPGGRRPNLNRLRSIPFTDDLSPMDGDDASREEAPVLLDDLVLPSLIHEGRIERAESRSSHLVVGVTVGMGPAIGGDRPEKRTRFFESFLSAASRAGARLGYPANDWRERPREPPTGLTPKPSW
jgi:hypothetical protein